MPRSIRCATMTALLLAVLPIPAAAAGQEHWIAAWYSAPFAPWAVSPATVPAVYANQTVRQVVRVEAGGSAIRLRLSNEPGFAPLRAGAVHVALVDDAGAIVPGSDHAVTFAGEAAPWIPAGAPLLSDSVAITVAPLQHLAISIWYDGAVMPSAHHADVQVAPGNQADRATLNQPTAQRGPALVSGVDVLHGEGSPVIVAFGDSITEGWGSTPGRNLSWPEQFASRLAADPKTREWSVVNAGISGNRLLHEGFGAPALARLDRDALAIPGVTHIVLLEGINDIGWWNKPDNEVNAAQVIGAYRQVVARAHGRGIKVIGATILPYKGAGYFTTEGEAMRKAVNAYIRTSGLFDGVIDFERATADPADPERLRPDLDPGDHLHPNDKGYAAMAAAIMTELFRK